MDRRKVGWREGAIRFFLFFPSFSSKTLSQQAPTYLPTYLSIYTIILTSSSSLCVCFTVLVCVCIGWVAGEDREGANKKERP
jgi:hypothetical protein